MATLVVERVSEHASGIPVVAETEKETPVRGRKAKAKAKLKAPTKVERQEILRERIKHLTEALDAAGFGGLLRIPGAVKPIAPETPDVKTGGFIGHIEEELGTYIQRVSIVDNFYQRQPFDHLNDKIYLRLIRDFIAKPPCRKQKSRPWMGGADGLNHWTRAGVKYSVIDGLQRLYCYCISILVVWQRENLIADRCITKESWDYLKDAVEKSGDPKQAVEEILKRKTRYEIFWNIDLEGLLHYMVTFNTGQRRMSLEVQLEIMQRPLLEALEHDAKIPIFQDNQNITGKQKPKNEFSASDLVMATRAFIEFNPQIKKPDEAESLLEREKGYTDIQTSFDVGDIKDVVATLKEDHDRIAPKDHGEVCGKSELQIHSLRRRRLSAEFCGRVRESSQHDEYDVARGRVRAPSKELEKAGGRSAKPRGISTDSRQHQVVARQSRPAACLRHVPSLLQYDDGHAGLGGHRPTNQHLAVVQQLNGL